jgi:hypothetical protein
MTISGNNQTKKKAVPVKFSAGPVSGAALYEKMLNSAASDWTSYMPAEETSSNPCASIMGSAEGTYYILMFVYTSETKGATRRLKEVLTYTSRLKADAKYKELVEAYGEWVNGEQNRSVLITSCKLWPAVTNTAGGMEGLHYWFEQSVQHKVYVNGPKANYKANNNA